MLQLVIVNDNPADRAMLRRMLNSSELDVDLVEIGTARELIQLPLAEYNCILLDHRLPDSDGIDALVHVCQERQYPPCPVVVMSNHGDEYTAARAFKAGANDYLIKDTLTPSRLSGTISNAIDKWYSEKALRSDWELQKDALRVAERANLAKTQFIANLSHRLRVPLTAILGFSQLIHDAELGDDKLAWEKYKIYASDINQSAQHVFDLMTGFIRLAQLESGVATISYTTFDPRKTLMETVAQFQKQVESAGLEIRIDDQKAPQTVCTDQHVLQTIMSNLLSNAIKFTPAGNAVSVTLIDLEGSQCLFAVSDTGIGMNPDDLQYLTKPFERYQDNTIAREYGFGIGLPLVSSLVKSLGGDINFETAPGDGLTATVIIPGSNVIDAVN